MRETYTVGQFLIIHQERVTLARKSKPCLILGVNRKEFCPSRQKSCRLDQSEVILGHKLILRLRRIKLQDITEREIPNGVLRMGDKSMLNKPNV